MTYTNDPANEPADELRFIVGDTDNSDLVLSDEEIVYLLARYPKVPVAAAYAAEAIAAFYARQVDSEIDAIRIIAGDRFDNYNKLALKLRREAGMYTSVPYAGGISVLDKEIDEDNEDVVKPLFSAEMQENRRWQFAAEVEEQ